MDSRRFALLEALKTAALHPGETRLYRRGKTPGLFAAADNEAADEAVRTGLLEVTRVETVGKSAVEWVRITQKGLDHLLQAESPAQVLQELRALLAANEAGLPTWLATMQAQLDELTARFNAELTQMRAQLDQVAQRAIAAIEQIQQAQPNAVSWAHDALNVLDGRKQVGLGPRCSLRELFLALQHAHPKLTLREYHHGLKCLLERGMLALFPDVPNGDAPGPEYALLDGATVYYYVSRA